MKDWTESRENDLFIYEVAKELTNNGIIIEKFWQKSDGTLDGRLSVIVHHDFSFDHKMVKIKKNSEGPTRWMDSINTINNFGVDDNHIYVLVDETNNLHIVPSRVYLSGVNIGHQEWLNSFGRYGQEHNDNDVRVFWDNDNLYLNNYNYFRV